MKILIKAATIVNSESAHHLKKVDILVNDGKIEAIDKSISTKADQVIEKENHHVSLGWLIAA